MQKVINFYSFLTLAICVLTQVNSYAQSYTDIGVELQAYPTGVIYGISLDKSIGSKDGIYLRLGRNVFDHRDLGVQDTEEGSGYGGSIGYKHYFSEGAERWRLGIKTDVWFNEVDWTDSENGVISTGTTEITVLQPTAELAYVWNFNGLVVSPAISFGVEWNVKTEGEPTGEGLILLAGLQIAKRF